MMDPIASRAPILDIEASQCDLDESQLPILITGIAGVAGYNAFYHFRRKYGDQVVGIRGVNNWRLNHDGMVACDIEDDARIGRLFDEHEFKSALNCGGSCALKACELDPAMADRVNVQGIKALVKHVKRFEAQLVHLSIDLVFSGTKNGDHVESDPADPVTVYGKTMVEAEEFLQAELPGSCILRISLPMGISFNNHAGAIDWIQSRFAKNRPATLYFDEVRTPTYVECLNETIEEVFAKRISGLFHSGGQNKWSLFQIAQIVNMTGGYDPELLIGCPRIEAGPIPPRAGNVTMNSTSLAQTLGRIPFASWPRNNDLHPTDREWHLDQRKFRGSPDKIISELYRRTL